MTDYDELLARADRLMELPWFDGESYDVMRDLAVALRAALAARPQSDEPLLGLATTRQLLAELTARIEVDGKLDYRTVDGGIQPDLAPAASAALTGEDDE